MSDGKGALSARKDNATMLGSRMTALPPFSEQQGAKPQSRVESSRWVAAAIVHRCHLRTRPRRSRRLRNQCAGQLLPESASSGPADLATASVLIEKIEAVSARCATQPGVRYRLDAFAERSLSNRCNT